MNYFSELFSYYSDNELLQKPILLVDIQRQSFSNLPPGNIISTITGTGVAGRSMLSRESNRSISFHLDQTKIWAVLDCSFRTEDGGITIIDWKAGRSMSEDFSMQLLCYAMSAMDNWGIDPEDVKLIEHNLFSNHGSEFDVSGAEIKNAKVYIAGSIANMQSLLVDVGKNVPKEEEAFQQVEDERVRANYNFRKVCECI